MRQTKSFVDAVWNVWIVENDVKTERLGSQCNSSANEVYHMT